MGREVLKGVTAEEIRTAPVIDMTGGPMSQRQTILDALRQGRKLTHLDALRDYGIARLAARICELRAAGHPVRADKIKVPTRAGESTVARYWLGG